MYTNIYIYIHIHIHIHIHNIYKQCFSNISLQATWLAIDESPWAAEIHRTSPKTLAATLATSQSSSWFVAVELWPQFLSFKRIIEKHPANPGFNDQSPASLIDRFPGVKPSRIYARNIMKWFEWNIHQIRWLSARNLHFFILTTHDYIGPPLSSKTTRLYHGFIMDLSIARKNSMSTSTAMVTTKL